MLRAKLKKEMTFFNQGRTFSFASAVLLSSVGLASAYCNGMNWPARTSTAFPPGWNGLAQTPPRGWRSWYAYATHMDQQMIELVVDALSARNRTVAGYDGLVSLCDLGFCSVGIDEGWEGCGLGGTSASAPTARPARNSRCARCEHGRISRPTPTRVVSLSFANPAQLMARNTT